MALTAPLITPHPQLAPSRPAIRVFVAEDHHITLWGLHALIDAASPRMEVVGTASSRDELLSHAAAATADVLLLDLDLGGEDVGAALASLRQRCPGHVLVLTGTDDVAQHRAAVMQGARGVVHKSEPAQTILNAIEKVNNGEVWIHRALLGEVLGLFTGGAPVAAPRTIDPHAERLSSLTAREREVVLTMVECTGAKQLVVADKLGMSEHTLRNHLTTIYSKLGVRGRLELHLFATTHGLGTATGRWLTE